MALSCTAKIAIAIAVLLFLIALILGGLYAADLVHFGKLEDPKK